MIERKPNGNNPGYGFSIKLAKVNDIQVLTFLDCKTLASMCGVSEYWSHEANNIKLWIFHIGSMSALSINSRKENLTKEEPTDDKSIVTAIKFKFRQRYTAESWRKKSKDFALAHPICAYPIESAIENVLYIINLPLRTLALQGVILSNHHSGAVQGVILSNHLSGAVYNYLASLPRNSENYIRQRQDSLMLPEYSEAAAYIYVNIKSYASTCKIKTKNFARNVYHFFNQASSNAPIALQSIKDAFCCTRTRPKKN